MYHVSAHASWIQLLTQLDRGEREMLSRYHVLNGSTNPNCLFIHPPVAREFDRSHFPGQKDVMIKTGKGERWLVREKKEEVVVIVSIKLSTHLEPFV